MPQAIKDIAPVAGLPNTMGSPLLRDVVPREDGLLAQRMKAAGCIVVGKTNTPEFGLGSHTFNEVFGVTRNAYDPSKSAGGSSGGAAVALATRMLPVADGSDFMGSLRNPAGWNNVFGLRPSQGRVPPWPVADVWVTQLGTEGPMARSVEDLARLLDVQAGPDARVPLSLAAHPSFASGLGEVEGASAHIGWLGDLAGYLAMEPQVLGVCEQALKRLAAPVLATSITAPVGSSGATQWAIKQGYADPARICIAGASYGGYATLMGLIRNPELYRCGFEWAGVTDIDLMYSIHWSDTSVDATIYGMPALIGDRVKDAVQLAATSPIRLADKVTQPLLLAYGGLDRRVPIEHGTQFRDAVRKTNKQVEWIDYPEEGHGWSTLKTDVDFWTRVEKFLDKNLRQAP